MAMRFETSQYVWAWGKSPRGYGNWCFGSKKNPDFGEKETYIFVTASYTDAKRVAKEWAKEHGYTTIYVLS